MLTFFVFFNDTATTEIYTLSLHDALPIWLLCSSDRGSQFFESLRTQNIRAGSDGIEAWRRHLRRNKTQVSILCVSPDRKSTRLNSSHANISYAVFCLKKKKQSASADYELN